MLHHFGPDIHYLSEEIKLVQQENDKKKRKNKHEAMTISGYHLWFVVNQFSKHVKSMFIFLKGGNKSTDVPDPSKTNAVHFLITEMRI